MKVMNGLTLWLDASMPDYINSDYWGNVIDWKDMSRNGADFQQHRKGFNPKSELRTINGRNVVSFDGASSFIHGMKNIKVGTILIVARVDHGFSDLAGLFGESLNNQNNIRLCKDNEFLGNSGTTAQDFTNAGGEMFINGVVSQKIDPQTPFVLTAFAAEPQLFTPLLSQNFFNDRFWKGDIGEVEIFDRRLSKDEQEHEQNYLFDRWGI